MLCGPLGIGEIVSHGAFGCTAKQVHAVARVVDPTDDRDQRAMFTLNLDGDTSGAREEDVSWGHALSEANLLREKGLLLSRHLLLDGLLGRILLLRVAGGDGRGRWNGRRGLGERGSSCSLLLGELLLRLLSDLLLRLLSDLLRRLLSELLLRLLRRLLSDLLLRLLSDLLKRLLSELLLRLLSRLLSDLLLRLLSDLLRRLLSELLLRLLSRLLSELLLRLLNDGLENGARRL